jgi:heme-degrading monooxygenase HmoA
MAFRVIWEFRPAEGGVAGFELAYGADGRWAELFRRGVGYLGTELVRPEAAGGWYRTIDRWRSEDDYEAFLEAFAAEYQALDAACTVLTADERFVVSGDT